MEDILIRIINIIMDSIEEFFNVIKIPSARYITDAFLVSLVFLALSVVNVFLNLKPFINIIKHIKQYVTNAKIPFVTNICKYIFFLL